MIIPGRYNGPPTSGNGGWVSGLVAAHTPVSPELPAVSVRLRLPPPLDRELILETGELTTLREGDSVIASAGAAPSPSGDLPAPVTLDEAHDAETRAIRPAEHPFPTCYGCGPLHPDGLQLRSGTVDDDSGRYAATWTPREVSGPEVWAALDCPGGKAAGFPATLMVLGTMTAEIFSVPVVGTEHVVLSWSRGDDGRKRHAASALFTADGQLLARADQTWIAIDPPA